MERWLEHFARANFLRGADTAHDLKTPLNVAVLNLELLRMRLRKLTDCDDPKLDGYAKSIEIELRRMGRIFDVYFLLCSPPKEEQPTAVDVAQLARAAAETAGFALADTEPAHTSAHESRIRQALKLFFEGASKVLKTEGRSAAASPDSTHYRLTVSGTADADDFETGKVFKFYYSDASGNPDLSLATARLIVETYGGELSAQQESDKVSLRLSLPRVNDEKSPDR